VRCFNSVPRRWVRFSSGTCLYPPAIRGYVLAFSWKRLAGSEKRGPASDQDLLSVERSELTRRLALASSARLECGRGFDSRPRRRPPRRPRRAMVACASLVDSRCPPVHLSTSPPASVRPHPLPLAASEQAQHPVLETGVAVDLDRDPPRRPAGGGQGVDELRVVGAAHRRSASAPCHLRDDPGRRFTRQPRK